MVSCIRLSASPRRPPTESTSSEVDRRSRFRPKGGRPVARWLASRLDGGAFPNLTSDGGRSVRRPQAGRKTSHRVSKTAVLERLLGLPEHVARAAPRGARSMKYLCLVHFA